jgi:hypothetical protein
VTQYWRLLSTFVYFGPLSLNLLFHIFFIQRYARMLEESAASVAHFAWLMAYAVISLLTIAPIANQAFLGTTLSSTLVYIWSRRNPDIRLSFLGLLTFKAPWLPWVLIAFNVVLHGHWPKDELCGIAVGHGEIKRAGRRRKGRLTCDSVVLLQRYLPVNARWSPTIRSTTVVVSAVRTRRAGCASTGHRYTCRRAEPRYSSAGCGGRTMTPLSSYQSQYMYTHHLHESSAPESDSLMFMTTLPALTRSSEYIVLKSGRHRAGPWCAFRRVDYGLQGLGRHIDASHFWADRMMLSTGGEACLSAAQSGENNTTFARM